MTDTSALRALHIIESGSYSDYRVHAAFERQEDAERFAAENGDFDTSTLPLYSAGVMPQKVITDWHVTASLYDDEALTVDGPDSRPDVTWDWDDTARLGPERPDFKLVWWPPDRCPPHGRWSFYAHCRDRGLAEKCVQDRLAEMKARRSGVTDGPVDLTEREDDY
jgi:hypothetical protein